ncbi:hypothetical protein Pyrde_1038 [Pyrodictium delaneyi]|uniref:Uncharacterized protein n=1 Tax=Pyrodictium delaneyi TaxID=1273541 RepID=A0A0P0N2Z1_9CREN|nr:hypothetical protein [Pyrodictium delaneyi]ALL01086.1 hypothetical protein Pyrde_1038 [Pyrodictium delaneyi]OWJ55331.1 hypothetical protein Pdsh_00455 [Pyrodictium delaneyi]
MSIFWERCSICGRHRPLRQCWIHSDRNICAYCCIACPERKVCPKPVWFPELREPRITRDRSEERVEARKALEELLKRLESS